jgi:NADH-quinone oxidoreductase subunit J
MKTERNQWMIATIVGGSLLVLLIAAALQVPEWRVLPASAVAAQSEDIPTATPLGMALLGARVDSDQVSEEKRPGLAGYLLPFEIISVHLLVVLLGAAYLARARQKRSTVPTT